MSPSDQEANPWAPGTSGGRVHRDHACAAEAQDVLKSMPNIVDLTRPCRASYLLSEFITLSQPRRTERMPHASH
jgi:hypothetical protein